MALEDAFFLAKFFKGKDLSDLASLQAGLGRYEEERLEYTNNVTKVARNLGKMYHGLPTPLAFLRDLFLDNSSLPGKKIAEDITKEAQDLLRAILDESEEKVYEPVQ